MEPGQEIIASELSGEFTLPKNSKEKLVFIAGGIGVTPFRSMLKYLLDKNEARDIVMLYSNRTPAEIAYREILAEAKANLGIRNVLTVTDPLPQGEKWSGQTGMLNANTIKKEVPDYLERSFYISGTHGMVVAFEKILRDLGVSQNKIKKDFFPGYV